VYKKFIERISNFIEEVKSIKMEPYWKYSDMYVIETDIKLNCTPNDMQFQEFLYKVSDKWQFFGIPVNEALASIDADGCSYIINGINMINIFY
jgi:hypothetical protein